MLLLFYQEHPEIPVELLEYGSIRASRLVQEEALDLALINMNFYEIDKLHSYEMLSDQIVFLCISGSSACHTKRSVYGNVKRRAFDHV